MIHRNRCTEVFLPLQVLHRLQLLARNRHNTFLNPLRIIAKDLGVPDDLNVEIRQSPKAYWESAGLWDIYVEITHNGKLVASGSFDVETGEMGRNIYIYTPV